MGFILGIETSCDETGAAIFDTKEDRLVSNALFSQIDMHKIYGGVVPEIAARSQLEKIDIIVQESLSQAQITLGDIEAIGVTYTPGLVGSLLIGLSFAKGLAWAAGKKLIGINHLEGHIFSSFLKEDGSIRNDLTFPHLCMSVSGGHTSIYIVHGFGEYEEIGRTIDDAAGEAFDKTAQLIGFGYPGGPEIEQAARLVDSQDFYSYPRNKNPKNYDFSFSGLKTAVLYDLVKKGAFDLKKNKILSGLTTAIQQKVSSSLQVCICDMFEDRIKRIFKAYPKLTGCTLVGGVSANKYISSRLKVVCENRGKWYTSPPLAYCTDNGAMIAFVAGYKSRQGRYDDFSLDVVRRRKG